MDVKETKLRIIQAGQKAVEELIKVAEEPIIGAKGTMIVEGKEVDLNSEELSADKLKNAAATKKLAIFDAFEILTRIEAEKAILEDKPVEDKKPTGGFAERRSRKK
jgi:hypothetical protein